MTEVTSDNGLGKFADPAVLAQVQLIQAVATVERPAANSDNMAWAMAWLHMVVWNSWKATYFFADKYPKDDFANYRDFAALSIEFLIEHHDAEEAVLFPQIETKVPGSMSENEAQHRAFLDGLVAAQTYLKGVNESDFKAETLRSKLDSILLPVMTHLAEELPTLAGPKLREHFSEDESKTLTQALHKANKGESAKALPFVLQNLPPGSPFPPAPGFVKNGLGPWVFWWKYKNLWKYTAFPFKPVLDATVPS